MPVDVIGDFAQRRLEILDRKMRQIPGASRVETACFPQDGARSARDRIREERAAILLHAGIRGKSITSAHLPAVRSYPGHRNAQPGEQRGDVAVSACAVAHVSSFTSVESAGRMTLLTGASGTTPSMRSAALMTLLNTRAAMAPP